MLIPPTSEIIAKYLEVKGLGLIGTDLFANKDATVANSITIYDTGGQRPILYDEQLMSRGIQIRTKDFDYSIGFQKQQNIFQILNEVTSQKILNRYYLIGIWLTSDFIYVTRDEKERHIITSNYSIQIQNSEVT